MDIINKENFITNIDNDEVVNITICLQVCNISEDDYFISNNAFDMLGNIMPNCKALYINRDKVGSNNINMFWQACCDINRVVYEEYKKAGFNIKEENINKCRLGMNREEIMKLC